MADIHSIGNAIEAGLWFAVAVFCAISCGCSVWKQRRSAIQSDSDKAAPAAAQPNSAMAVVACVAFAAFGLSDLVEIETGAWWRPWWLLLWKAACVAVFVSLWWRYRYLKSKQ